MNVKAHEHTAQLKTYTDGFNCWNVRYGDTTVWVYPFPLSILMKRRSPSAKRLAYITRKAIRLHDRGSIRAGKREQRENLGRQRMQTVRSDWYMKSQERMDKLHAEALYENRLHSTLINFPNDPGRLLGLELPDGRHVVNVSARSGEPIHITDEWGTGYTVGPDGQLVRGYSGY